MAVEAVLQEGLPTMEQRHLVIAATPTLREREAGKMASMTDGLTGTVQRRGVAAEQVTLAAWTGAVAFTHALNVWMQEPSTSLCRHDERAFEIIGALFADNPSEG